MYINYAFSNVEIHVNAPAEAGRQVKNLGVGAVTGALLAGPTGAVAGAWVGSKVKNVHLKVVLTDGEVSISILGKVAIGFIGAWEKANQIVISEDDFSLNFEEGHLPALKNLLKPPQNHRAKHVETPDPAEFSISHTHSVNVANDRQRVCRRLSLGVRPSQVLLRLLNLKFLTTFCG